MTISGWENFKMLATAAGSIALPRVPFHIEPPAGFDGADGADAPFKPTWESLSATLQLWRVYA
jgi:hypothetical protein